MTQLINTLGWRSLEQRRADARLKMFYKIVHGLVEIPLPSYIHRQARMTRTTHPYHFIQIKTTANYYKYSFFPLAIIILARGCCSIYRKKVRRAEIKARLLTGTYTLQSNRAKFNQYNVSPICKLCKKKKKRS